MLTIGPYQLKTPFVQAALSGYSDWPMRTLAKAHGASYCIAEVMIDTFAIEVKGTGKTSHYLHVDKQDHPVGGQLMGSDPDTFAPAALRLVEAGFDVIDINFGCPVKTAIGGCRGGYHLGQPEVATEIVQRVRDVVPAEIPVTVKMRRGIDDTSASYDNFFKILDAAFQIGVAAITVHGRTVEQKYIGPSCWSFLKEVKQHVGNKVILGSGDLFSAEDCFNMLEQTGVDGVTIARGAIGNPWIFTQARALWLGEPLPLPPTLHEQRDVMQRHLALAEQMFGKEKSLGQLRKFSFKYARLHPEAEALKAAFSTVKTRHDWEAVLTRYYHIDLPGMYPQVNDAQQV